MSKTTKALAVLGVVAGLGVSMLPLSSYAVSDSAVLSVSTTLAESLSITFDDVVDDPTTPGTDTATKTLDITGLKNLGHAEGSVAVKVITNANNGYTVNVKGTTSADLTGGTTGETIASLATPNIADDATESNWAFKVSTTTGTVDGVTADTYTQVKTTDQKIAETSAATAGDSYTFTVGVAADGDQAADTYTGSLTFTAATK